RRRRAASQPRSPHLRATVTSARRQQPLRRAGGRARRQSRPTQRPSARSGGRSAGPERERRPTARAPVPPRQTVRRPSRPHAHDTAPSTASVLPLPSKRTHLWERAFGGVHSVLPDTDELPTAAVILLNDLKWFAQPMTSRSGWPRFE